MEVWISLVGEAGVQGHPESYHFQESFQAIFDYYLL